MTGEEKPRALKRTVILDRQTWVAGDVPPPEVAQRITNPAAWADEDDYYAVWTPEAPGEHPVTSSGITPAAAAPHGVQGHPDAAPGLSGAVPGAAGTPEGGVLATQSDGTPPDQPAVNEPASAGDDDPEDAPAEQPAAPEPARRRKSSGKTGDPTK